MIIIHRIEHTVNKNLLGLCPGIDNSGISLPDMLDFRIQKRDVYATQF